MSVAQKRAYDQLLAQYAIAFSPHALDWIAPLDAMRRPCSKSDSAWARPPRRLRKRIPRTNYLGVEVHSPGVGSLLKLIGERGLANVRIVQHDAVEVVEHMIAPGSLAGIHIFFPDPWPKKRHHKRRLDPAAIRPSARIVARAWRLFASGDGLGGVRTADARRAQSMSRCSSTLCPITHRARNIVR